MAKKVSLEELLKESDVVVLSITASEENREFMNRSKFSKMKEKSIFLNHSRPWLVNENDFYNALGNKLAGAWFDFEMPSAHPKLVTTPHLGGATRESRAKSEMIVARKLYDFSKGNRSNI